jgi:hypothetical protein
MKLTLNNGTEWNVVAVNGQTRNFQGTNRDALEFQFAKTIPQTFEDLDMIFANPENTKRITLQGDNGSFLHENYTLRVSMSLIPVIISAETPTGPEVIEERYSIIMAQKSYMELQVESLQAAVTAITGSV